MDPEVGSQADPTELKEPIPDTEETNKLVKRKVPDQLVMEFLINMMKHDYVVADKLCQMILLYDPEHKQALSFKPLLQEMIQALKDNHEESSESEDSSESSDSSETDSSETDSNETSSNSSSDSKELELDSRNQD